MRVTAVRVRVSARVYGRVGVCVWGGGGGQTVGGCRTDVHWQHSCVRPCGPRGHHVLDLILRSLPMNFPTTSRTETAECLD